MLNIALPKGRLAEETFRLLTQAQLAPKGMIDDSRKLIFVNPDYQITLYLAKPSDVATYVERGAADIGIVGKDCLIEAQPNVYELADLGFGACKMAIAAPVNFVEDENRPLRVATKYVNCATAYYEKMQRDIDIIKLSGSIELAPIIGLSDVICDIVQTGQTLKENGLEVIADVFNISARLIANKSNYEFKRRHIEQIAHALARTE